MFDFPADLSSNLLNEYRNFSCLYHLSIVTIVKGLGDANIHYVVIGSTPVPGIFEKLALHIRFTKDLSPNILNEENDWSFALPLVLQAGSEMRLPCVETLVHRT